MDVTPGVERRVRGGVEGNRKPLSPSLTVPKNGRIVGGEGQGVVVKSKRGVETVIETGEWLSIGHTQKIHTTLSLTPLSSLYQSKRGMCRGSLEKRSR